MNDKVKTINIDGIEVQTSLTPVELADLPQKYAELQSNWNSLRDELKQAYREIFEHELVNGRELINNILDKMNELEGVDSNGK